MDERWRIELLGGLRAVQGDRVVTRFRTQKTGLLLAYLAFHTSPGSRSPRSFQREQLMELLWPEVERRAGLNHLKATLRWLRQELEPPGVPFGAVLRADRTYVGLDPAVVTTDVAEFAAALEAAARAATSAERGTQIAQAVELYRGELLPGCHEEWVLQERQWLGERFFHALGQQIAHLEQAGDLSRALELAQRGVSLDPLREEAHTELMRLFAAAGQPEAAVRQYAELERLLKESLAETPSAATRALAGQIERQTVIRRPPPVHSRPPSTPPVVGENRLVMVLFADMSRSVETMRELHPEDAVALINRLFGVMVDAVLQYEGQVDRFLGDGMLAVFGLLQAHEDDAERAIRAALAIREGARRLGLEVTAGVNTGSVYVGEVGSEQHQERTVVGPVVNLAARLQEQAQPGQLLVGEATRYQSRHAFQFAPRSLTLQGFPQPVPAHAVTGALSRPQKARGLEGLRAELIGREREQAQLQEALAALQNGQGQMVSLIGEAGVGKSRLVAELKQGVGDRVQGKGFDGSPPTPYTLSPIPLFLEGRCLELNMTTGYSLFLDLLREYFGWGAGAGERERVERLLAALQAFVDQGDLTAERAEEMAPLLGNLFALRSGTDWDLRLKNASPEQIRHQTLVALQEFFVALARRLPVVLVLEDLHWADPLSLDLISLLMEALSQAPLLLLCVYRPEREHRCWQLATIASRKCPERSTEVTLRELTPAQSRRLVQALLGSEALPAAVTEQVLQEAQGNPFFVEEVIQALLEAGTLYRKAEAWRVREAKAEATVPTSVQSVILSRLDRLEREVRQVLESASVLGRLFRRRLLEQIWSADQVFRCSGVQEGPPERLNPRTPERLNAVLWELEERGLIYQERVVPEAEYSFKHVLTQETIYGSLLRRQRSALHQQVGEAIESLYRDELEEQYEPLAYHYERSEADEKAVEYLLKAGEKARRVYLNEEAIGYFRRALERLDGTALGEASKEWRLEALKGLGLVYHGIGRQKEAEQSFRQAIVVGQAMGLPPSGIAHLYTWLIDVLSWVSRNEELLGLVEEGLALVGEDAETVEAAQFRMHLLQDLRNTEFAERLPYSEGLRPVYDNIVITYAATEKDAAEAERWLCRLKRRAEENHDLRAAAGACHLTGWLLAQKGDHAKAIPHLQQGLDAFRRISDSKHESRVLGDQGLSFLKLGEIDLAERVTQSALELLQRVGMRAGGHYDLPAAQIVLGTVWLCRGLPERALEPFVQAVAVERSPRTLLPLAWCYLHLAMPQEATPLLHEAISRADGCPSVLADALAGLEQVTDGTTARNAQGEGLDPGNRSQVRWLPQPCCSGPFPCCLVRERFAEALPDGWRWHDPFGDAVWRVADGLIVEAPNDRNLWGLNHGAPRLLRTHGGGFALQAICSAASPHRPAIGGLVVWKDGQNYLRLDRGARGQDEVMFSGCVANQDRLFGRGRLPAARLWLRLERTEEKVRALCSVDGSSWLAVGETEFPAADPVEAGLHAIGTIDRLIYPGPYPEGTAIRFENCEIWT